MTIYPQSLFRAYVIKKSSISSSVVRISWSFTPASRASVTECASMLWISEENAASAETTNQAMSDLNDATVSLANTAQELKRLSDELNEDLEFFKIG